MNRSFALMGLGFSLGLTLACGGKSHTDPGTGTMNVSLAPQAYRGFQNSYPDPDNVVNLRIQAVEIKGEDDWVLLGEPNSTFDLVGQVPVDTWRYHVTQGSVLPAGHYNQMRLILGKDSATVSGGVSTPLQVGVGFGGEIAFKVDLEVPKDGLSDINVVLDPGDRGYGIFPTCEAVEAGGTGSISGVISNFASVHAVVCAETVDAQGAPHIVRSCLTRADGSYKLDLLPLGQSYHVVSTLTTGSGMLLVSQPILSDAITLTAAARDASFDATYSWEQEFTWFPIRGNIQGPDNGYVNTTSVAILRELDLPSGGKGTFIVDLCLGLDGDYWANQGLLYGTYQFLATRTAWNAHGIVDTVTAAPRTVVLSPDEPSTPTDFQF